MNTLANNHYLGLGKVFHGRRAPTKHAFTMSVYMLWINLNAANKKTQIDTQTNSINEFNIGNLSRFTPQDYWQKTAITANQLQQQIIEEWHSRGLEIDSVCVLSNPRSLNTAMNPLSVFYCYSNNQLKAILAEVTNTPWGERHHYFLVIGNDEGIRCTAKTDWHNNELVFNFDKQFHVSPFYPMDLTYEMRFKKNQEKLSVVMKLRKQGSPVFDASLNLILQPLTEHMWRKSFWLKPWMTMQVRVRIYFEALRLAIKRTPFYSHPKKKRL